MTLLHSYISIVVAQFLLNGVLASNLTCYQCKRDTDTECSPDDLLPCAASSDRCVTLITNSGKVAGDFQQTSMSEKGFLIKRECGLGPCSFDDVMVNKGLGMDVCDRSKDQYFCLFCCRENGCNKSDAKWFLPSKILLLLTLLVICLLNVTGDFLPPYFMSNKLEK